MLEGLEPERRNYGCKVKEILVSLEAMDQVVLELALDNKEWSALGLSKALRARGIVLGKDTIKNHREKTCHCSKI
jgi:hypothetical protein